MRQILAWTFFVLGCAYGISIAVLGYMAFLGYWPEQLPVWLFEVIDDVRNQRFSNPLNVLLLALPLMVFFGCAKLLE